MNTGNLLRTRINDLFATKTMVAITTIAYIGWIILTIICFLSSYYFMLLSTLLTGVFAPWTFGAITTTITKCGRKPASYQAVQNIEKDEEPSRIFDTKPSRSALYHLFTFMYMFIYLIIFIIYYYKQGSKLLLNHLC